MASVAIVGYDDSGLDGRTVDEGGDGSSREGKDSGAGCSIAISRTSKATSEGSNEDSVGVDSGVLPGWRTAG